MFWRNKLQFKQYIPNRRSQFGINSSVFARLLNTCGTALSILEGRQMLQLTKLSLSRSWVSVVLLFSSLCRSYTSKDIVNIWIIDTQAKSCSLAWKRMIPLLVERQNTTDWIHQKPKNCFTESTHSEEIETR